MSFASIGGILLIIASWFTYRGNIFMSIILYLAADLCWFGIALSAGDYFWWSFGIDRNVVRYRCFYKDE